ncbi:MAG: rhodanese-like domain-containing protein [Dehalococcoidia bacterium]|nr:rhodanese-like domain-containing protein [Dehalococcoidia bacterium]MDW8119805.1 rhodanese-like domain-containing protein [Chloroflexota bacterium]
MVRRDPGEPFARISVDEAYQMLQRERENVAIIDVRTPEEYQKGHVKGAHFLPVDQILERIHELPKGKKLLFICQAGQRSALAAEMAAAMGVDPDLLYNIEDGTPAWIERNYPTSYGNDP